MEDLEMFNLYISGKAKRREAIDYIDQKVKEEGGSRNSIVWNYVIQGVERDKDGRK